MLNHSVLQPISPLDLGNLPEVIPPKQLAPVFFTTADRLANDRYHGRGLPYVKYGSRVFYLRSDVIAFLAANRHDPALRDQR